MGYRGDDASRARADSQRQQPWQSSSGRQSWHDEQGYGHPQEFAQDYAPAGYGDNEWYGGAPGGGFADTSTDMRAYPGDDPESRLPYTGQQEILDETQYDIPLDAHRGYVPPDAFADPDGYGAQQDYDDYDDYDGYDGYGDGFDGQDPRRERYTDGFEALRDGNGGPGRSSTRPRPGKTKSGKTKSSKTGPGKTWPGKAESGDPRRRRKMLVSATAVFSVVVAAAAAYTFIFRPKGQGGNDASATGPLPSPGSTSASTVACARQLGQYCHIEFRTGDPKPLTVQELFPTQFTNEADHTSFTRLGTRLDTTCSNAVIGQNLITALRAGQCSQVVRASYVTDNKLIMGTIGVVNLSTTNEAHHAGKLVGASDFIAPLSTITGIASKLGQGTGVVQAQFKGHYLILTWAEFTSLKPPANAAQGRELQQFEDDLVSGTANIALSQRMVHGVPATPSA